MALSSSTLFNIQSTATASFVNGAGFNPGNANFPTDYTVDTGTGNTSSPVLSSATYSFVAGDVGAWIYIKAGTNWYARTWLQIASVSGGKATLSAAIGAGFIQDATNPIIYTATTVAGVASTGTPTGGTCGVDYSQSDAAIATATDFAQTNASTNYTSASAPFRRSMVGNVLRRTTTGTNGAVGFSEIISYTSTSSVVVDNTGQGTGLDCTGQTAYIGGAGTFTASNVDPFFEALPLGAQVWVKAGTYTLGALVNVSASLGTPTTPNWVIGYNSRRGDGPTGSNRPLIQCAALQWAMSTETNMSNLRFITQAINGIQSGANSIVDNCYVLNNATTVNYVGFTSGGGVVRYSDCEAISQNGRAWSAGSGGARLVGCYAHDSDIGVLSTTGTLTLIRCKVEACLTAAVDTACVAQNMYESCTFYGREAKSGIGCRFTGASSQGHTIANCMFYGLTTGISASTQQGIDQDELNFFYNCTTNATGWYLEPHTVTTTDPGFTGAAQITGSTATTSGSVLTQSGGDFSTVTDNIDMLHVLSGTGVTVGRYLITSHTSTTLTVNNALGTGAAVAYFVTTGHNLQIGTNLRAAGGPNFSNMGIEDRSYLDPGCMQRQEVATGGGGAMIVRIP